MECLKRKDLIASTLAEPNSSSSLHSLRNVFYSQDPTFPYFLRRDQHFQGSEKKKKRLPDGLQHGMVLDIPNHPHSGWSGPRSRGKPGKPSLEPMTSTVSQPPPSSGVGYSRWLTILAASTFLIFILPELYSLVFAPSLPYPTETAPTSGSNSLDQDHFSVLTLTLSHLPFDYNPFFLRNLNSGGS